MFKDREWKKIEGEVSNALETFSLEEILEQGDLTIEEALTYLIINGLLELPEVTNLGNIS